MTSPASFLTRPVFGHSETRAHFSDQAICSGMIAFEIALAQAQAELGEIPQAAATSISALRDVTNVSTAALEDGVRSAGVPVPALIKSLRASLKPEHADWIHYGATSQDVVDTALCLCAGAALDDLATQLRRVIAELARQSDTYRDTIMLARTRGQLATPITFGLRIAQWAQPLIALETELESVRTAALRVQFGGASGSRGVAGQAGERLSRLMAETLDLHDSPPWHTDRNALRRLANWLARLVQAVAKIGRDLAVSARGEVAEATAGQMGGSSTMPHKSNPVLAEAVQSLAPIATAYEAGLSASAVHAEERDGALWPVEWVLMPALFETTGAALAQAFELVSNITVHADRMAARVKEMPEVMAEAAVFALAPKMGRVKAGQLVNATLAEGRSLQDLVSRVDGIDPEDVFGEAAFCVPATVVARQIFANVTVKDAG
jgi:3-carboxy-cis,cis-muconate cycloisomerase